MSTLLERAGLGARVPRWRAVAMLGPWFAAGWSIAGLLYALDHHPDRPEAPSRGDAARAARDPLRILGHRLTPWRGRFTDLPVGLAAVDGAARRARQLAAEQALNTSSPTRAERPARAGATPAVRAAARAELARVLTRRRLR